MAVRKTLPENPSNRDLLKEFRAFREDYSTMSTNVQTLMDWKRGLEIAQNAVDAYKREEAQAQSHSQQKRYYTNRTQLVKDLIQLVFVLSALVYAISQGIGR